MKIIIISIVGFIFGCFMILFAQPISIAAHYFDFNLFFMMVAGFGLLIYSGVRLGLGLRELGKWRSMEYTECLRIFSQPRAEAKIPSALRPVTLAAQRKKLCSETTRPFLPLGETEPGSSRKLSFQQKAGYYHLERPGAGQNPFALADVGQKTCRQQLEATNW
jgi:hypothetical protein